MLIEFKVKNFMSFKSLATLSMVAVKSYKELQEENTHKLDENNRLLKTAVIYGNNASGKSNLLRAVSFMRQIIIKSFSSSLSDDEGFRYQKFLLNTKSQNEPTYFEMTFIKSKIKYRYGFELSDKEVISEWLYHTTTKEVYLFTREFQKIKINKSAFKEGIGKELNTKKNVLFLTLCAQLNGKLASEILEWFLVCNHISSINDNQYNKYTFNKIKKDKEFLNWVSQFVRYLEITNVSTYEAPKKETSTGGNDDEFTGTILTHHPRYNEHNTLVDTIAFNLDYEESEGTKKLLYLLGPWFDTLTTGKVLFVDEMDARLHTHLTRNLIKFFHQTNTNGAQLVFTTHDVSLLQRDIFRRDQIWFVNKDQFGASEINSLADFNSSDVRNTSAFEKNYIDGTYGAIPYFDLDEKLMNSLYGQGEK